nr:putative transposase (putative), gypsy type [Tanacetum cinerariifolium]
MSFSKRPGSDVVCYTKPLDSLKNWSDRFFWVDAFACFASFPWNTSKGMPKDPFPKSSEFNAEYFATLVALPAPFHKYQESFLCLVGISRYYTLDEDVYPEFLGDNDEGMDLLAFIRTANPTKVKVAERQRAENEPRLLESTVGRVVPLLPIAPARASSELEASVDKLFDEGASGDGQDADVRPVAMTTDTIVEDVAPLQPRRQRKRKTTKLREDYGALGGASTAGKSMYAVQSLFTGAVLDAEARAEYNIREKRKLRAVVDEQAELLKAKDGEIESLKAQFLLKEAEAVEAIRLRERFLRKREKNELGVKMTDLSASIKVRQQEVADLDAQVTAVKLQKDNLVGQVRISMIEPLSSCGLQEKVAAYEGFVGQLEKFQDEKLEEVNEKFDKLCADFVDMALHLEEKLYPHLLTTISGRKWLLTYGIELAVAKCLNSTEYLSALGAAIIKAVEKGMQEGLPAGITHGAEGRQLADVAAYNPSAEADYLSALQYLQSVNFSLIAELKSNKDASVDTIINLLRSNDVLAERLGLTESQPYVNQLMVPIHHSPDQRVVGASALSLSLEVSHSRVKKMRENIANHVSALRGMFVPLSEPLSVAALKGMEGTSSSTHDAATTLSTTFVFASTIPPISTDDYEVAHADGQGGASVDDETAAVDDMNLLGLLYATVAVCSLYNLS